MTAEQSTTSDSSNYTSTPLEHFFREQGTNTEMFYEAVPYVSMTLKKPLALFLKMQEIQQIISGFDDQETLAACGLYENMHTNQPSQNNVEEMLLAMRKKASSPIATKLDLVINFFKAEKIISTYQRYVTNQTSSEQNGSSNDLFSQILPLLLTNTSTSQTDLIHLAEQIQNAAKGADYEPKMAN